MHYHSKPSSSKAACPPSAFGSSTLLRRLAMVTYRCRKTECRTPIALRKRRCESAGVHSNERERREIRASMCREQCRGINGAASQTPHERPTLARPSTHRTTCSHAYTHTCRWSGDAILPREEGRGIEEDEDVLDGNNGVMPYGGRSVPVPIIPVPPPPEAPVWDAERCAPSCTRQDSR
jgi:hypothetical protein